jgi:hypothetical protein
MVTLLGVRSCAFTGFAIMSRCDPDKLYALGRTGLEESHVSLVYAFPKALCGGCLGKQKKGWGAIVLFVERIW